MSKIPLCKSSYLQDVTIAIGRRRKRFGYARCSFSVGVDKDGIEYLGMNGGEIRIYVWADALAQVIYDRATSRYREAEYESFHPDITSFTPEGVAYAMRESVAACCQADLFTAWDHVVTSLVENQDS